MDEEKGSKLLARHGNYDLVVCTDEDGFLVYGLREKGKLILTENDRDAFYDRVGMVSGHWELWLQTMPAIEDEEPDKSPPTEDREAVPVKPDDDDGPF